MLFNSIEFLVFAAVFFAFWPLAKKNHNIRWLYITLASLIFYGWWEWRYVCLILFTGLASYSMGLGIARYPAYRRPFLFAALFSNLGLLAVFKYSHFIATNVDTLASHLGYSLNLASGIPNFFLVLPVGISFYTFQALSYVFDIYRGEIEPTRNILHYFAYLSMFPQLVAGPIHRAGDMLRQLEAPERVSESRQWESLKLVIFGYFKKVVIADNLAPVVTAAFSASSLDPSSTYWLSVITAYAFQIYFDFSGYSSIARGLAGWMGLDYNKNFDHPYTASSLQEFWTRWHISLTTWFRDYLFFPVSRLLLKASDQRHKSLIRTASYATTMLAIGIWHGANWTFVAWGMVHAFFYSIEQITRWPGRLAKLKGVGRWLSLGLVMAQVWLVWIFFRADTITQAWRIITIIFRFSGRLSSGGLVGTGAILFLALGVLSEVPAFLKGDARLLDRAPVAWRRWLEPVFVAVILVCCVFLRGPGAEFIYFQF